MVRNLWVVLALAALACRTSRPAPPPLAAPASPAEASAPATSDPDRSRPPGTGPAPQLKVPPQRRFDLPNGLQVRLVENHKLPLVSLSLVVDAGAVHDPKDRPGLASFTAAMLTEGTKRRSATRISDDLGFIGASLGAAAGFDAASLSGSALAAHLDELLDVFAEVLAQPAFPPGDFARVQDQRRVALLQQRDQAGVLAARAFQQAYWGDHPYGHWPLGTEASVQATRRGDLVRFHAARWRPRGATLIVVGDVTEAALRPKLEEKLASWQGSPAPDAAAARVQPPVKSLTVLVPKPGASPQSYLLMGMPGLQRSSPDYVATEVALEVLGGGSASRLFRDLREKEGYTYGIYARADARKLGGASLVVGSVKTEVTGPATRALLQELERMRTEPVPQGELDVAKNSLLLSLPADFALNAGIASKLAEEVVHGLPDDYWNRYADRVRAVTSEEVQGAAQKYLDVSRLVTVMVGAPKVMKPQLAGLPLGPVEVRAPARGVAPAARLPVPAS